jgi:hypothetical protein
MTTQNSVANPFSRTARSLNADGHAPTLLGMLTVILLLFVWGVWFSVASISIYESSDQAQLTSAQRVTAFFPAGTSEGIRRGQAARFYPQGVGWEQASPLPAVVAKVTTDSDASQTRVELALRPVRSLPVALKQGQAGRVEIESEQVSPATLVFRAGGLANQATDQNRAAN